MSGGEAATGVTLSELFRKARTIHWSGVIRSGVRLGLGGGRSRVSLLLAGIFGVKCSATRRVRPAKIRTPLRWRDTRLLHTIRSPLRQMAARAFSSKREPARPVRTEREKRLRSRASSASQARSRRTALQPCCIARHPGRPMTTAEWEGVGCPSERFAPLARKAPGESRRRSSKQAREEGHPTPSSPSRSP